MVMREVSIEAEEWCNEMGITAAREQLLISTLAELAKPSTRSELAYASGLRINCVTRPIKNLVEHGILVELEPREDKDSGRMAHPLWFKREVAAEPDLRQVRLL